MLVPSEGKPCSICVYIRRYGTHISVEKYTQIIYKGNYFPNACIKAVTYLHVVCLISTIKGCKNM